MNQILRIVRTTPTDPPGDYDAAPRGAHGRDAAKHGTPITLRRSVACAMLMAACACSGLHAQAAWVNLQDRYGHALARDGARAVIVLFGGQVGPSGYLNDTWVRAADGSWTRQYSKTSPSARANHTMVYAATQGKVFLFGGRTSGGLVNEGWQWDGASWGQTTPPVTPSPREYHAMAWDSIRNRVVLFGGFDGSAPLADHWEHDGTNWINRAPIQTPPARFGHSLSFNPVTGRCILFGGNGYRQDTWEYDSVINTWISRSTGANNTPVGRQNHWTEFNFANNKTVLFGGKDATLATLSDTWEWEPSVLPLGGWVKKTPAVSPPGRHGHGLTYELSATFSGVIMFGGSDSQGRPLSDTWAWDGVTWAEPFPAPPARSYSAAAYDELRQRVVLFGGKHATGYFGDTWEWEGGKWVRKFQQVAPPVLCAHRLVYSTARNRVVLFGGSVASTNFNETWEYDGQTWVKPTLANSPSPRENFSMTYDSLRSQIVLYGGGLQNQQAIGDTWIYDQNGWLQLSPMNKPSPRAGSAIAYDKVRDRVVLFGGLTPTAGVAETWEWDGANWAQASPANSPSARYNAAMHFDPVRSRCVLFGGADGTQVFGDTWEWDGSNWFLRNPGIAPSPRQAAAACFSGLSNRLFLYGGQDFSGTNFLADTWEYGTNAPALSAKYGTSCPGSALPLLLLPLPGSLPWIGETLLLVIGNEPPAQLITVSLGVSNRFYGALPLPYDLSVIGMTGCMLLASYDVGWPAVGGAWMLPIPNMPSLLGSRFYNQAFAVDPTAAGPLRITTSNGLENLIGSR